MPLQLVVEKSPSCVTAPKKPEEEGGWCVARGRGYSVTTYTRYTGDAGGGETRVGRGR